MACADLGEMGANMFDQQVGTCATLHPDFFFNVAVTTCLLPSRSVESPFSVRVVEAIQLSFAPVCRGGFQ